LPSFDYGMMFVVSRYSGAIWPQAPTAGFET
jgi:hypothetical protein